MMKLKGSKILAISASLAFHPLEFNQLNLSFSASLLLGLIALVINVDVLIFALPRAILGLATS
ncbi:MAG: hypothetical protein PVF82_09535 [Gammaproteobacteria bacterium]